MNETAPNANRETLTQTQQRFIDIVSLHALQEDEESMLPGYNRRGEYSIQIGTLDFLADSVEFRCNQPDSREPRTDTIEFKFNGQPVMSINHLFGGASFQEGEFSFAFGYDDGTSFDSETYVDRILNSILRIKYDGDMNSVDQQG